MQDSEEMGKICMNIVNNFPNQKTFGWKQQKLAGKKLAVLALKKRTTFTIFAVRIGFTLAIACVTILIYIVTS